MERTQRPLHVPTSSGDSFLHSTPDCMATPAGQVQRESTKNELGSQRSGQQVCLHERSYRRVLITRSNPSSSNLSKRTPKGARCRQAVDHTFVIRRMPESNPSIDHARLTSPTPEAMSCSRVSRDDADCGGSDVIVL
jgi:hypothetical protein